MQQFPVTGYTSHGRRAVVGEYITHSQDRLTPACMQRPDLAYGTVTLYGELRLTPYGELTHTELNHYASWLAEYAS